MRKKFIKRIFSAVTACTLLMSLCHTAVFAAKNAPAEAILPAGHTIILQDDFESYSDTIKTSATGTGWNGIAKSQTALVEAVKEGENTVARLSNTAEKTGYPRLAKALGMKMSAVTVQFSVKINSGNSKLEYFADGKVKTTLLNISGSSENMVNGWNSVRVDIDFEKGTYEAKLNGKKYDNGTVVAAEDEASGQIRFNTAISPGGYIMYDNVLISTPDDIESVRIIKNDGSVNFDLLKGNEGAEMVSELRQHPRIFVNSFSDIKEKIANDHTSGTWYEKVKTEGDKILAQPVYEYTLSSRSNILEISRGIYARAYVLSLLYNIEGDTRYLDRAYKELEAAAAFPNWTPNAFLATAELMQSYAVAYDWLYYGLSDAQKKVLTDAVMNLGVTPLVYNYEGNATGTNFTTNDINWNPVCNSSAIITALGMVADTYPNVAEYILEKAAKALPHAMPPYAPNGAYPEGTGYWTYGTDYLVYGMAALDKAFKDGYALPEKYVFYNYPGISETADYAVYYTGPVGAFNFGDSGTGKISTPSLYWFAEKFNKPQYAARQRDLEKSGETKLSAKNSVLALIWYNPDNAQAVPGAFSLDKAYSSAEKKHNGVALRSSFENSNALYAAMQGGYNRANHQYLSLGTFMIEAEGERWFTMRGYGSYDYPNYFSNSTNESPRWTYYVTRAEAQNTIIANPTSAADQECNAIAQIVKFESTDAEGFGVLDMTQTNKDFKDAKRGIYMRDNRSSVLLQDEIQASKASEFWWFAHTDAQISIAPDGRSAMLSIGDKRMYVNMEEAPEEARFILMDSRPLATSPNPSVQTFNFGKKLAIHITGVKNLNLAVSFTPLKEGEAAPAQTHEFVPISKWKAAKGELGTKQKTGDSTVLMLQSPNALSSGEKTYIDKDNLDVVPFEKDGRTLVPVRFISEGIGAEVGWEEQTGTVSVKEGGKTVKLVIGSRKMDIDGKITTLDVPAETINDRTMLPLRALAEALGRNVFWDERGLIVISDSAENYSADLINSLVDLLSVRVKTDGKDLSFFDPDKDTYYISVDKDAQQAPAISAQSADGTVINAVSDGAFSPAVLTIGGREYTFNFVKDIYTEKVTNADVSIGFENEEELPKENPWIEVKNTEISGGFNYGAEGLTDNDLKTSWRAEGEQWVSFDLGEEQDIYAMGLATMSGDKRKAKFDIEVSDDNQSWRSVIKGGLTSGETLMPDIIKLDTHARYVKIFGHGNTTNLWNSYAEVRFYKNAAQADTDKSLWDRYFNSGEAVIAKGQSLKLVISGILPDGTETALPEDTKHTFVSSDKSVVSVDENGNVKGVKAGEAQITVCSYNSQMYKINYMKVTVK